MIRRGSKATEQQLQGLQYFSFSCIIYLKGKLFFIGFVKLMRLFFFASKYGNKTLWHTFGMMNIKQKP
jgi:hypothetical protein